MVKKLKELSNQDIDNAMADDRGYGGCVSKDDLPKSLGRKFYIVNMQDSDAGHGTHWVLLDNRGSSVNYFDSMGQVPPLIVKKLMNATGKKQVINKFQLQPMGSVTCGWWCMAMAKTLGMGIPMSEFIGNFDLEHPKANDVRISKLFS